MSRRWRFIFRELNAQPPFAPVLPIPEQEVTETEPESEPSVETAETAAEPAEEPVTDTMPQNLSDNEYAIYTALRMQVFLRPALQL